MSEVLRHLILRPPISTSQDVEPVVSTSKASSTGKDRKTAGGARHDDRNDKQIKDDFKTLCGSDEYMGMLATRKRLPAFAAKDDFLRNLIQSRVIVVVGETGDFFFILPRSYH
jgi:HrpA-like RNA helicase